jgi:hypothetical protein
VIGDPVTFALIGQDDDIMSNFTQTGGELAAVSTDSGLANDPRSL